MVLTLWEYFYLLLRLSRWLLLFYVAWAARIAIYEIEL